MRDTDPYPVYHDGHSSPRVPRQRSGGDAHLPDAPHGPHLSREPHPLLPFLVRGLRENTTHTTSGRTSRLTALCPLCALEVRD